MRDKGSFQRRAGFSRFLEVVLGALVVLVALVASALGQTATQPISQDATVAQAAPVQRTHTPRKPFRAARLTYLSGSVTVVQASSKMQDAAVVNMPLVEGTALTTGEDGQAEIEFEDGSLLRITPNSGVSLLNLSVDGNGEYKTRAAVLGGLVYAELRAGTKYQYSIDAGGSIVTPAENSTIRFNLDEPPALIAMIQGSAHVGAANSTATIDAQGGQTARADSGQSGTFTLKDEIAPETWDQWSEDRDQGAASEAGAQTAARDQFAGDQGYGWSDLDANGSWYSLPGQGNIWQPNIAEDSGAEGSDDQDAGSGFDPYGYGSWVWTPAGYSWASGYGWGWLPYRCGQWGYYDGFGWGWQPGISCGVFGFGGYGFGGVYIGRAPGSWRRPKRPVPGPGPVHPIVRGRVGPVPVAGPQYGSGRMIHVKTIDGQSIEPLPPVSSGYVIARSGSATGSALRRDYPVNTASHEPSFGVVSSHNAPETGRAPWQPPGGSQAGRSYIMPVSPGYSREGQRSAPVLRSAPAPAQHSSPPAASHSAPAPASSPHK